jgi:pyruvate/2-oxoglutarate dehydrogenase complex dihydrolipoamide dehydrogenase (E3) component
VPTIVTSVPNSAFVDISSAVAEHVDIPVVASNRINMPQAAEEILADTHVRLISMARPLLSDLDWVNKAQADAADEINTCILNTRAGVDELAGYDEVVLATGVAPRIPDIPGIDHPMVLSYAEAIMGRPVGKTVAVVGASGIGFDVSEFLVTDESPTLNLKEWKAEWGVADPQEARGALTTPIPAPAAR